MAKKTSKSSSRQGATKQSAPPAARDKNAELDSDANNPAQQKHKSASAKPGSAVAGASAAPGPAQSSVPSGDSRSAGEVIGVRLLKSEAVPSGRRSFWKAIKAATAATSFEKYQAFIKHALCSGSETSAPHAQLSELPKPLRGVKAYQILKQATEIFLLKNMRELPLNAEQIEGELSQRTALLPYYQRILRNAGLTVNEQADSPFCSDVMWSSAQYPVFLEYIWSYWQEEGMLVQSMHLLSLRFQNKRRGAASSPIAGLTLNPLRPVSNLLWGYIQDQGNRLNVVRRSYEYESQYGISLIGKAIPKLRPVDQRSAFIESFHNLLYKLICFYQKDANTTITADGFPLLTGLRELHRVLAEGALNQFSELTFAARVEMMVMQWILAQREIHEFLRGKPMVPYEEPWMAQIDTMKRLCGWGDTSVIHFHELATKGERLLLSIRLGDWSNESQINETDAKDWAREWKTTVQGYIHAYRVVTGVDLTDKDKLDYSMPALHLKRRARRA